ncbi:MAG: zonular occludens toxin domain-containing protein, partial [Achromobacter mucicolens]
PPHVDAMARHRHNGFDFILISQKHNQLDSFLQGLIETHIHVRRKWGFNRAVLKTWDQFQSNTKATDTIASPLWKYPKRIFGMYTSATQHTFKAKLPWFYYAFAVLLPLVIYGFWHMTHPAPPPGATVGQVQPGQQSNQVGDKADDALRRRDFVAWMTPRVPGQPWTAPAWDNLQPQGVPDLYCMAVETGECGCMTEQGTKYEVPAPVCRKIARDGSYNPFRKPVDDRQRERGREPHQERQSHPDGDQGGAVAVAAPSGYWPKSTIPQDYSPPDHQIATQETYQ